MSVSTDLKTLFPNYDINYHIGKTTISEKGIQAKVKEIHWVNSDFHYIDTSIVKEFTQFFQKSGTPHIFHLDCDGIILFEENGKKYIFISELKSSFDMRDLYYAKDQIISSFIKINMILHLLPNYRKEDYVFKGFIACLSPNAEFIRELHKGLFFKRGNRFKTEAEFADELYHDKSIKLKASECDQLRNLPLGNNCLFNELEFHYLEVPSGNNSYTVDVLQYI
ncbi:hypothetical protein [Bacteroides sp. 519]|uniref:hypothetical protein n=1 Tax=Bacteroides sp. 519 TaxID=2302937 RepID=UPI0013D58261|nr:hypothetical protein [Bacteroides sp. 519]NDV57393.1 hypothetical protein [Bacteroides sp. 519]